jgi:hypothetical protein
MLQTEFEFTLPKGYIDRDGNLHRQGIMRLANAKDEIAPLEDPRVHRNQAYLVVILLARVITQLGDLRISIPGSLKICFQQTSPISRISTGALMPAVIRGPWSYVRTASVSSRSPSHFSMVAMAWGDNALPPGASHPGGSVHCLSFPLAQR